MVLLARGGEGASFVFVSGLQRTVDRAQCQLMEEGKGTGMVGSCDLCNMQHMTDLSTELETMVGITLLLQLLTCSA